ncbi:HNH endonuclease [Pseudoxanthomonas mexicana]|uniref:HNH endonuclease n=1 Tax=Pseudoxanthomonas mexicana TaxID=128785 RepID=UPI001FD66B73|nr:HNH endonuclease [Pseudoxanthomonas mexicana]UOV04885.1 HNH endonuclease [Pseudoxanthomonas mexicana]
MSREHIVPLSLGGSDQFCIPVDREYNSKAGSKIDGVIANDFMTSLRRAEFDSRGHSRKPAQAVLKQSRMGLEQRPVQVTFGGQARRMQVWDAKERRNLGIDEICEQSFSSTFKLDKQDRYRFLAKVCLSAGYFIYADMFRNHVDHRSLRLLMNYDASVDEPLVEGMALRGYDEFTPVDSPDAQEVATHKYLCQMIGGSCVMVLPGPENLGFVVGILGKWMGTLNVPAITESFPWDDVHDLGHVVALTDGEAARMSYRRVVEDAYARIQQQSD